MLEKNVKNINFYYDRMHVVKNHMQHIFRPKKGLLMQTFLIPLQELFINKGGKPLR
jgi:hypothetical protein